MKRNRPPGFFVCATAVACASGCSTGTSRAAEEGRIPRPATPLVANSTPVACPSTLPPETACVNFVDRRGAKGTAVKPPNWNGTLALFNHGGPRYTGGGPRDSLMYGHPAIPGGLGGDDVIEYVEKGFAFAASTFLQHGYIPEETPSTRRTRDWPSSSYSALPRGRSSTARRTEPSSALGRSSSSRPRMPARCSSAAKCTAR